MTQNEVASLNLGISPIDDRVILIIESGVEWLKTNTTIDCNNLSALPACARLFLTKFYDVQMLSAGVTSQSIEGLSQSYDTGDKNALVWQYAEELLSNYLKSNVTFFAASSRWE